jgi:hypothetical protein
MIVTIVGSCQWQRPDCDKSCKAFFADQGGYNIAVFRGYPLVVQYDIYRYGSDQTEPPRLDLALPIAERGATAAAFIREKLTPRFDDKLSARDAMLVLADMQSKGYYDVRGDEQLMIAVKAACARSEVMWKPQCEIFVLEIEAHQGS